MSMQRGMMLLLLLATPPWAEPLNLADSSSWLNVRDCRASASKFETRATTTAGSSQIVVKDNIIPRGETTGVRSAVAVHGLFKLIGNHITGFDENDSTALSLVADPFGRVSRNLCRDNIFEKCAHAVTESQKPLEKSHVH